MSRSQLRRARRARRTPGAPERRGLEIRRNERGRAVFTTAELRKGALVEVAPIVVVAKDYWRAPRIAREFAYYWRGACAIALGYGSLYNHSYSPNLAWKLRIRDRSIEFRALRRIDAGEELTINYNGAPDDPGLMDFEVKDEATLASRKTSRRRSRPPSG